MDNYTWMNICGSDYCPDCSKRILSLYKDNLLPQDIISFKKLKTIKIECNIDILICETNDCFNFIFLD